MRVWQRNMRQSIGAAWETMWCTAERISGLAYPRTLEIVTNYLRSIDVQISPKELDALVEERKKLAEQLPLRH
jgi:hypothetical protein